MASFDKDRDIDTCSLVNNDELDNEQAAELQSVVAPDGQGRASHHRHIVKDEQRANPEYRSEDLQRRSRAERTSARFYDSCEESQSETLRGRASTETYKVRHAKHLPHWIWICVITILGVRPAKRYVATFLYILTLSSACAFTILGVAFTVFDIASRNTKTTAHIGFIALLLGFSWIALGIYSFNLAGRLFSDPRFAASVRIHARTFFKISSALILVLLGIGFTGLNLYSASSTFFSHNCENVGLFGFVCNGIYISRCIFTAISMCWNLMVGCMLLSVCRTHTIGIRRFIQDLYEDGLKYEDFWREKLRQSRMYNLETASILQNEWFLLSEDMISQGCEDVRERATRLEDGTDKESPPVEGSSHQDFDSIQQDVIPDQGGTCNNVGNDMVQTDRLTGDNIRKDETMDPPVMTVDELLLCYWKISSRMRLTSQCLQRWLASWIAFVLIWCADYVIYWLSESPNVLDIMEFLVPMLLLLVLCSAYAEANGEGQRMIRCICPTKERFGLLNFLNIQPLQMQVFGLSISYNAMMTVILAFAVAFSSRLILDEVMK